VYAEQLYHLVIGSHDPHSLARFWSAVLAQPILFEADDEVIVGAHKQGVTPESERGLSY